MKKLLIGVIVILVIAGVGAPYVNGLVLEHAVKQSYNDINMMYAETGSGVSLELVEYDRGYWSSEIKWKMHLGNLRNFYGVKEIEVINRAKHGLTGVMSRTSLEPNEWYSDFVNQKLDGKDPLHISSHFGLIGDFETSVRLDGFSFPANGDMVSVEPGKVRFAYSRNLKHVSAEGFWQGLAAPGKASLNGFSLKGDFNKITTFIWDGNCSFTLNSFESTEGPQPIKMSNLATGYKLSYNKGTNSLDVGISYGVDSIAGSQGIIVDDAAVRLVVNHLDAQGYEAFLKTYLKRVNSALEEAAITPQDPVQQQKIIKRKMGGMNLQIVAACEKVLKKGLAFRITDLEAQLPAGKISGNLIVDLKEDIVFSQLGQVLLDPSLALNLFSLQTDASMPADLVGNAPMLTTPLFQGMQTGLFVKSDDKLVHKAETRDGKLMLNGHAVAL
jgi:uncharacterized protein YdgA (DUF945 family)